MRCHDKTHKTNSISRSFIKADAEIIVTKAVFQYVVGETLRIENPCNDQADDYCDCYYFN